MKKTIWLLLCIILIISIFRFVSFEKIKTNVLRFFYKTDYSIYVEKYSKEYDVDKYLIFSMIKAESNFKENAISDKGAKGLMQLMDFTAKEIADKINIEINEENILEPELNINIGTKYISVLIKKYENINLALAAYNAGSGNVDEWIKNEILKSDGSNIENVPFLETNNYVRKILRDYEIYKQIYLREDI